MSEEELMGELDEAEADDTALALVRRLQRTRKQSLKAKGRRK